MTDPSTLAALGPAPPLAPVHADARLARARSRSSSRAAEGSYAHRHARAGATSTACRRSGATCTATATRRSTRRCARSSTASPTRRCSGSAACRRSSWRTRSSQVAPPGLTRVFYSDAGATAVEIALGSRSSTGSCAATTRRTRFASLVEAYHGDTLGAVGVGYSETFHRFFRPRRARGAPDAAARLPLAARAGRRGRARRGARRGRAHARRARRRRSRR